MDFFISDAMAQTAGASEPGGLMSLLPLILIFIVFYFLLIRPQMKRQKEQRKMVEALAKGDEVVTNGGLLGHVDDVGETFLTVTLAEGVQVKVQRHSVAAVMPKGTIKGA